MPHPTRVIRLIIFAELPVLGNDVPRADSVFRGDLGGTAKTTGIRLPGSDHHIANANAINGDHRQFVGVRIQCPEFEAIPPAGSDIGHRARKCCIGHRDVERPPIGSNSVVGITGHHDQSRLNPGQIGHARNRSADWEFA